MMNKVIHGDCMEELDNIPSNSIDMILTDPPYFIPTNSYIQRGSVEMLSRNIDDTSIMVTYFKEFFKKIKRISKPTSAWYVFCDGQSYPIFYNTILPLVKNVRPLIWDKMHNKLGYTWRHQHELIAFATLHDFKKIPTSEGDVLRYKTIPTLKRDHPAQKPTALLSHLLSKHPECHTVLDPFCGSGSSLVAAQNNGKEYLGIEINEDYVKICNDRLDASVKHHTVIQKQETLLETKK